VKGEHAALLKKQNWTSFYINDLVTRAERGFENGTRNCKIVQLASIFVQDFRKGSQLPVTQP